MWDPTADAYFSGLADGEATFLLNLNHRPGGRPSIAPRFSMNLRADDVGVLRALQTAFGGRLSLDRRPQGVLLYVAQGGVGAFDALIVLREALRSGRVYRPPVAEPSASALRLVG